MPDQDTPRLFRLERDVDISGVSGSGHVADGVLWPDGSATVHWRGEWRTDASHPAGMPSVEGVHGHGGATRIVWDTPIPAKLGALADEFSRLGDTAVDELLARTGDFVDECDSAAECHAAATVLTWKLAAFKLRKVLRSGSTGGITIAAGGLTITDPSAIVEFPGGDR